MKKGNILFIALLLIAIPAIGQSTIAASTYYTCHWREFYGIPALDSTINLSYPDYELLDAAIFHATNEARAQEQYPPFKYHHALHEAAKLHSNFMIELDFYNHYNSENTDYYFPLDRVRDFDKKIPLIGENIAEFPLIESKRIYCPEKAADGYFVYLNCKSREVLTPYTYLEYAKLVVNSWMHSPPHRKNILNPDFTYLGCSARFSKDPYKERRLPFARLTQNLGGYLK